MRLCRPLRFCLLSILAANQFAAATGITDQECRNQCGFEEEPFLEAADLLQPSLLNGPGFKVDPKVAIRGYTAHFTLDTKYGPLTADSVEQLAEREAELPALDVLDTATRSDALMHAAGRRVMGALTAVGNVFVHPVDTIVGVPTGLMRYFSARLDKYSNQAQTAGDRVGKKIGNKGNPNPDAVGPMNAARRENPYVAPSINADLAAEDAAEKSDVACADKSCKAATSAAKSSATQDEEKPPEHTGKTWYTRAGAELKRAALREIQYESTRRALAQQLGIDPYSGNAMVQERMDTLTQAAVVGNLGAGFGLGAVGGTGASVLAAGGRYNEIVWQRNAADIRVYNKKRLDAWCDGDLTTRLFIRRGSFTPTTQTAFVDELEALQPKGSCGEWLELAITTRNETEARYMINALRLIRHYTDGARGGTLITIGAALAYQTPQGELLLPLPLDYLSWTPQMAEFFARPELRKSRVTVLTGGLASSKAMRQLSTHGWNLVPRASYEGAPPYADVNVSFLTEH